MATHRVYTHFRDRKYENTKIESKNLEINHPTIPIHTHTSTYTHLQIAYYIIRLKKSKYIIYGDLLIFIAFVKKKTHTQRINQRKQFNRNETIAFIAVF